VNRHLGPRDRSDGSAYGGQGSVIDHQFGEGIEQGPGVSEYANVARRGDFNK
jgi:hypothetical protein